MTGPVLLVSSTAAAGYDLGEGHPMRAIRGELTIALAEQLGVLDRPVWTRCEAGPTRPEELHLVHRDHFVAMVASADDLSPTMLAYIGLGTEDTPVVPGLHDAASAIVGATLTACQAVWSGRAAHAVNLSGGLHHAMPAHASGFCVYNDAAVGIADLLRAGCARVAYIDLDAHHGDGVETIFAADPRVLTVSLHQDGRTLFPGTGAPTDIGGAGAEGSAVNVALPPETGDAGWLRALHGVVPDVLHEFRPDVIVMQSGCDGHARDPLTDLNLSIEGFTIAYELVHRLAHELCDGRWVILGGGGYDLGSAVPRTWTQLLAVCSGEALPAATLLPEAWRKASQRITGRPAPERLGDGVGRICVRPWDAGEGDPDDVLDRAIAATRRAVLPLHGLDPVESARR